LEAHRITIEDVYKIAKYKDIPKEKAEEIIDGLVKLSEFAYYIITKNLNK